jgi:hypothetical protein
MCGLCTVQHRAHQYELQQLKQVCCSLRSLLVVGLLASLSLALSKSRSQELSTDLETNLISTYEQRQNQASISQSALFWRPDEPAWRKLHCIFRALVATYAVGMSVGFSVFMTNVEVGQDTKRCWYQYGPNQIWIDIAFMVPLLLFDIALFFRLLNPQTTKVSLLVRNSFFTKDSFDDDATQARIDQQSSSSTSPKLSARPQLKPPRQSALLESTESLGSDYSDGEQDQFLSSRSMSDAKYEYDGLPVSEQEAFLRERMLLSSMHFRVAFLLAISIVTLFLSLFVASSIGALQERGLKGDSLRGSPLSLLFILVAVEDGQGILLAMLFVTESHCVQTYSAMCSYLTVAVRKYVYDIEDDGRSSAKLSSLALSIESGEIDAVISGLALEELAATMAEDRTLVQTRRYRFTKYKACFRGNAAVTWLVANHKAANRVEAESFGMQMMARGLLYHVTREHLFYDKDFFYRFDIRRGSGITCALDSPRNVPVLISERGRVDELGGGASARGVTRPQRGVQRETSGVI